jgi:dienelactone hydrolase
MPLAHLMAARLRAALVGLVMLLVLAGCDGADDGMQPPTPDVNALFAPPTAAEVAAVEADWAARDVSARGAAIMATGMVTITGTRYAVQVVAHDVPDGTGGTVRHVGAIAVPEGAEAPGSLAPLVFAHGGDEGVDVDATLALIPLLLAEAPELSGQLAFVIPAFRAEPLTFDGRRFDAEGPPSPWDRDVDDALALLNVALDTQPILDAERLGVLGFSRGAGVALLMGARDPRLREVVAFFGPTDFFLPAVRAAMEDMLAGATDDRPGLAVLAARVLRPWADGDLSTDAARLALVRRSSARFAARMPNTQVHHGTADAVVDVSHARSLARAMDALGRGPATAPRFRAELYDGGTHDLRTLDADGSLSNGATSLDLTAAAFLRLLPETAAAAAATTTAAAAPTTARGRPYR